MWKLFIFTFLCLFLTTSCVDDTSGDVKTIQIATATATVQLDNSSDDNSNSMSSATAVAQVTSVKTNDSSGPSSGPSSGSGSSPNSNGTLDEGSSNEEDDDDNECNLEERDDDYDCTSAMPRVERAIIKILFIRKNLFLKNNIVNNNYYCNINQTQGNEGHVGSPLAIWYVLAMITLYTKDGEEREEKTLSELLDYLGLENKDECRCVMKKMRRTHKSLLKDLFNYSTTIMADKKRYVFTELFRRDVIEFLNGRVLSSNFSQPLKSAKKVNKQTAAKTGNLILDVVSKDKASTVFNTNQSIINVIGTYLKPVLKMSLNTENKTTGIYYGFTPTLTEYLYQEVIYNSTESRTLNSRLISIELKNNYTRCLIIVPNTKCDLPSMVAKLASEPQILQDEMKCLEPTCMCLTMPVYESFTYVTNVVPALQSTCEIDSVFSTKSQIIDSCGKSLNRSVTYIHEKSIAMLSQIGEEPYEPASAEDCSGCGEPVTVRINSPAIFIYFVYNIPVAGVIGKVKEVDSCTN